MTKVAVLVGSLRRDSLSRKLAHALAAAAPPILTFDFVEIGHHARTDQEFLLKLRKLCLMKPPADRV